MEKKISAVRLRAYIISGIFLLIFVLQNLYVLRCNRLEFKPVYILICLPAIIALVIIVLTFLRIYEKKKILRITAVILLVISAFPMACSWFYYQFFNEPFYESDINQYRQVINIEGYPFDKMISHFPAKITDDMENARFSFSTYLDMFTYYGENLLLVYKTTPVNLEHLKKRYIKNDEETRLTSSNDASGILYHAYIDSDENVVSLPDDFQAYILKINSKNSDPSNYKISGVAFSDERCEVVYFYENRLNERVK